MSLRDRPAGRLVSTGSDHPRTATGVIALRGERRFGAGDAAVVHVTASVGGCPLEPLALCHEPISHGWLLLIQNAVVRDRDRGLGDGIDVDRGLDGSAPGR